MDRSKMPQPLDPFAVENASVHAMYASNVPGMTDAKLAVDLLALLSVAAPSKNQLIAAKQIAVEINRRILKS